MLEIVKARLAEVASMTRVLLTDFAYILTPAVIVYVIATFPFTAVLDGDSSLVLKGLRAQPVRAARWAPVWHLVILASAACAAFAYVLFTEGDEHGSDEGRLLRITMVFFLTLLMLIAYVICLGCLVTYSGIATHHRDGLSRADALIGISSSLRITGWVFAATALGIGAVRAFYDDSRAVAVIGGVVLAAGAAQSLYLAFAATVATSVYARNAELFLGYDLSSPHVSPHIDVWIAEKLLLDSIAYALFLAASLWPVIRRAAGRARRNAMIVCVTGSFGFFMLTVHLIVNYKGAAGSIVYR